MTLFTLWDPGSRATSGSCPRRACPPRPGASSSRAAPGRGGARRPRARARPVGVHRRAARVLVEEPVAGCSTSSSPSTTAPRARSRCRTPRTRSWTALELGGVLHPSSARACATRSSAAHVHRRRAGARQDRPGAGRARGGRRLPGRRRVPGEHEADVGARGRAVAAASAAWRCWTAARRRPGRRPREAAEIVVINYDILEAHSERLAGRSRARSCSTSPTTSRTRARGARRRRSRWRAACRRARCGWRSPARRS